MLLFSTQKYEPLKMKFLKNKFFKEGILDEKIFSDGEKYTRIKSNFKNKDVAVLGSTITDEDIMDIYDLSCALVKLGAKSLSIIIPFFGYSTMERGVKSGEVVKAKTRARLLSLIPTAYQGNNIILVDLHKEGIAHYFENSVHAINISTDKLFINKIKELKLNNYAIAATDEGGAKRARIVADKLGVPALFILKRRTDDGVFLEATGYNGDRSIKNIVIIDDMIRSGSSVLNALEAFQEEGSENFYVLATHGVFCGNGNSKLTKNRKIKKVVVTDSHVNSWEAEGVDIFSIVDIVTKELRSLTK